MAGRSTGGSDAACCSRRRSARAAAIRMPIRAGAALPAQRHADVAGGRCATARRARTSPPAYDEHSAGGWPRARRRACWRRCIGALAAAASGGLLDEPLGGTADRNGRDDPRGAITPRQLLWQLSGLPGRRHSRPLNPFSPRAQLASGPDFERARCTAKHIWPGHRFAFRTVARQCAVAGAGGRATRRHAAMPQLLEQHAVVAARRSRPRRRCWIIRAARLPRTAASGSACGLAAAGAAAGQRVAGSATGSCCPRIRDADGHGLAGASRATAWASAWSTRAGPARCCCWTRRAAAAGRAATAAGHCSGSAAATATRAGCTTAGAGSWHSAVTAGSSSE